MVVCPQQPAPVLISSGSQFIDWQPSTTIKHNGPLLGPVVFVSDLARETKPRPERTPGSERTAGMNCFMPAAVRTARAWKRERGLQGRFPPAPPFTRARIVSGPFSLCVSPGRRGGVLRAVCGQIPRNRPDFAPIPSLFSVSPAGRRNGWLLKFNDLRAAVHCQPRRCH